jgi:hypothetical protein
MIFEHNFLIKYLKNRKAEPTKLSRLFTFKSLDKQKERGLRKEGRYRRIKNIYYLERR